MLSWEQEVPLALPWDTIIAQSCITPPYILRQRVTHDCVSIISLIVYIAI